MKKILLLGSNGQLGKDIKKLFREKGDYRIIPATREDIDLEYPELIYDFLSKHTFSCLINCASYHKTDECEDFPEKSFKINGESVKEIADFCRSNGAVFFHVSTDYVFDGKTHSSYSEEDQTLPLNVYGKSKLAGETAIQKAHDKYFIMRVSSLFGEAGSSGKGGNFVETMLRMAKENKSIRVVDDQVMSPTHTLDIARAIHALIEQNITQYGIYHCSGVGECSWYDFAKEIFSQAGISADLSPISSSEMNLKAQRPERSVLNNSKLSTFYKMKDWKESLNEYLKIKEYI